MLVIVLSYPLKSDSKNVLIISANSLFLLIGK